MNSRHLIIIHLTLATILYISHPALSRAKENIKMGDSRDTIIKTMGKPTGNFLVGTAEVLTYKRGMIKLQDGKVSKCHLVSHEEAEIIKAEQKQQQAIKEAAHERHLADGNAIRINKNADKNFAKLPASERLKFWESFKKEYPSVSIAKEIALAKKELQIETTAENKKVLKEIEFEITQTEALIETRANATGLSRPALINARKELVILRQQLESLNIVKKEITNKRVASTIINEDKK